MVKEIDITELTIQIQIQYHMTHNIGVYEKWYNRITKDMLGRERHLIMVLAYMFGIRKWRHWDGFGYWEQDVNMQKMLIIIKQNEEFIPESYYKLSRKAIPTHYVGFNFIEQ